jgi:formate hydrogenlyase transcriptional activator
MDVATSTDHGADARFRSLYSVAESITACRDLDELFRRLVDELQTLVSFDFLGLVVYEPERGIARTRVLETTGMVLAQRPERAIADTPAGWVIESQQPLVIMDTAAETRWPAVMTEIRQHGIVTFCSLPLTTPRRRLGTLAFGRHERATYATADVEFMSEVSKLVAVAVENALNLDDAQALQRQLSAERDHLRLLLDVTNALGSNIDLAGLIDVVSSALQRAIPHEFTSLALREEGDDAHLVVRAGAFKSGPRDCREGKQMPIDGSPSGRAFRARRTVIFDDEELRAAFHPVAGALCEAGLRSLCCVPLMVRDDVLGTLNVGSLEPDAFTPAAVDMIEAIARQVGMAVANAMAFHKIATLKDKLAEERLYLESEIHTEHRFGEIIGESRALGRVLEQTEVVAPTDSTVLILGETGTGKELLARAIHERSGRRARTFVKINCAAIPSGLLESELFGHEKGAFTGAIAQKMGRFEVAHGGTLFLDEVGEIPPELQPKLLRVLQEHEFERIGGNKTIKVDVRLIAATNRDLARMVEEQRFRDDLYYRLNVFPIVVPPLRERPEDIPALVRSFVQRLARPMNRNVEVIPSDTLAALSRYRWPGNVRELANLIERSMILSPGRILQVPLAELNGSHPVETRETETATLKGIERAHILRALDETNWTLGGPRGAAARLGMKRTTLQSLMKRLAISRPA